MKRLTTAITMMALASAAVLAACVEQGETTDSDAVQTTAVDEQSAEQALEAVADELGVGEDGSLGTLDDSDEAPAFGSDQLADEYGDGEGDVAVDDPMADDSTLPERVRDGEMELYRVMVVWGRIRPNDQDPIGLRWDPALQVREGDGVHVRRQLRFERGDRVHPQEQRSEVRISSLTRPHVDGVIVEVRIRAQDREQAFFRFRSLPVSVQVPVGDLADLNQFTLIDRAGNGVMFVALDVTDDPAGCAHGFMEGRWAHTRDNGGVFGGAWRSEDGAHLGYVAGRYGVTDAGEHVFHGKVIDEAGRFRAFMAGTWGEGSYRGLLFNRAGEEIGQVAGHYTTVDGERGHGRFRGGWRAQCGPDDTPVPGDQASTCTPDTDRPCDPATGTDPAGDGSGTTDGAGDGSGSSRDGSGGTDGLDG